MAGKKKGKKGKKGKKDKKSKEPPKLVVPNFVPVHRLPMPIGVKINHMKDKFLVYTDEYDEPSKILEQLSSILKKEPEQMRLYFKNRRIIEPSTVNHDQQIVHNTELYLSCKGEEGYENIREIINSDIYEIDIQAALDKKEEEKKEEQRRIEEEERKKKELEEKKLFSRIGK